MAKLGKDSVLVIVNADNTHTRIRCKSKELSLSKTRIDVTDDGNTNRAYLSGYPEYTFSISGVWQYDDGHKALKQAFDSNTELNLLLTTAGGDTYSGNFLVLNFSLSLGLDDGESFTCELVPSSDITYTAAQ